MSVLPENHGSTTFSPRITSYDLLAQRIRRQLGEPLIDVEAANEQIYECIDMACEFFTKFSGITEEFMIFDSSLYQRGTGLQIDRLFNSTPDLRSTEIDGLSAGWDYDMNAYRKVIEIHSFEPGNNNGVNTLFTLEHTIAQQAYFGHLMGNVGYDLVTWHSLKTWLDTREKMLSLQPYLRFYPERQLLKIIPEPPTNTRYYGLIACKIQKPIKDIISQLWVHKYTMAKVKQNIGHIRGKFSGTILFGGQQVNAADVMTQGVADEEKLEAQMISGGYDMEPPRFISG